MSVFAKAGTLLAGSLVVGAVIPWGLVESSPKRRLPLPDEAMPLGTRTLTVHVILEHRQQPAAEPPSGECIVAAPGQTAHATIQVRPPAAGKSGEKDDVTLVLSVSPPAPVGHASSAFPMPGAQ